MNTTRRNMILGVGAMASFIVMPQTVFAVSAAQAESTVKKLIARVMGIINSGGSKSAMYTKFEKVFLQYADVPYIAKSSLGPKWKKVTPAQQKAYTQAFSGYMARKYGSKFKDFEGAKITVDSVTPRKRGYNVRSTVHQKGEPAYKITWTVGASGNSRITNIVIVGISVLGMERNVIANMLEARGGDIDKLTASLKKKS